jgi:Leucine-rich repeat (LRR) protein
MEESMDIFSRFPNELLNDIILFSHTTVSPNKRWKKQIEIIATRTMKELQTITNDVNNNNSGMHALKSYYLTLKQQAEKKNMIWNRVVMNYSPLSSGFYQVLNQEIEDTDLKIFWTHLSINGKPYLDNPEEIRVWMKENNALLRKITSLEVWGRELSHMPKQIIQLQQLQYLYLHYNQITQIPSDIGQLQQLQRLYLYNNQITQIPSEIGQLQQLQWLYLNDNQITQVPSEIGQLQQLRYLDLSGNQFIQLPLEILQLQQLQQLYLSANQIAQLPIAFSHMSKIIQLK